MSTPLNSWDIMFRNLFKTEEGFSPTTFANKQPHPLDIYYNDEGLYFEIACTGLTREDIDLNVDGDLLQISYKKSEDESFDYTGYIYKGLARKSFNLGYKISSKYDLTKTEGKMENGLLTISIPVAVDKKPKSIKIK